MTTEGIARYAHCQHCCWGSQHHPDAAPHHETPCVVGCASHDPIQESDQAALFNVDVNNVPVQHS